VGDGTGFWIKPKLSAGGGVGTGRGKSWGCVHGAVGLANQLGAKHDHRIKIMLVGVRNGRSGKKPFGNWKIGPAGLGPRGSCRQARFTGQAGEFGPAFTNRTLPAFRNEKKIILRAGVKSPGPGKEADNGPTDFRFYLFTTVFCTSLRARVSTGTVNGPPPAGGAGCNGTKTRSFEKKEWGVVGQIVGGRRGKKRGSKAKSQGKGRLFFFLFSLAEKKKPNSAKLAPRGFDCFGGFMDTGSWMGAGFLRW